MVVYIDDISVEGDVPDDWEATNRQKAKEWLDASKANKSAALQKFEKELAPVRAKTKRIVSKIPDDAILKSIPPKPWGLYADDLLKQIRDKTNELVKETAPGRTELPTTLIPVSDQQAEYLRNIQDTKIRPLEASIENLERLRGRKDPFLVFIQDEVISNYRILHGTKMINGVISDDLSLFASPGEYEPGGFVIIPARTTKITFELGDLRNGNTVMDKNALDLKTVKVWYQGNISGARLNKKILTPELLLHDANLVKVDYDREINIVRDIDSPKDSPKLLPVDIPAMTAKQFWLTAHVPDNTKPGLYTGTIKIKAEGLGEKLLNVHLRVFPIKLAEPQYEYSLYYRGYIGGNLPMFVSSELKNHQQLAAEFRNMKAHGITNPNVYQRFDKHFDKYIEIRKQAGLKMDPLYFLGVGAGSYTDDKKIKDHMVLIRKVLNWAKGKDINTVYFYGSDEAKGEALKSQRKTWKALHDTGGKVFVACSTGFFDLAGDLLDLPIIARESKEDVPRVHAHGHKIHYYSNPAGAIEQPKTYRYHFGYWLDRSGMDGVQTYVYQGGHGPDRHLGRIWDDYDSQARYRNQAFAYPTIDGVVDTLQWEGVREGVDDVRYLTTLRLVISKAKKSVNPKTIELAKKTEKWLADLNVEGDLQKLRYKIAEKIIAINKALSE